MDFAKPAEETTMAKTDKKNTERVPEQETQQAPATPAPQPTKEEKKEIQVIERIIESKEIAPSDAFGKLTRSQINLIKTTVAKGASDDELKLFIQVCKGANLNPFLRQVHLVPRWDSKAGMEVRTIQVGIDGFRAVAESSNQYAGNDDPIFEGEQEVSYSTAKDGKRTIKAPEKATVTVYKLMEGQRYPFVATARWEEYYPGAKMGFQWHVRPYLMLGKCAEALALRKAFPKLLSGMYAAEELDKTQPQGMPESEKMQKGYEKLKETIAKGTPEECDALWVLMEKSEKYTATQKAEVKKLIEQRKVEFGKELDKQNQ